MSNEVDEFIISCMSPVSKLIISRLGYITDTVLIDKVNNQTIKLRPDIIMLPEVEIAQNYALELFISVRKKMKAQRDRMFYSKSFIRSYSYINKEPSQLNEALFDVNMNSSGTWGCRFEKGRYALKRGWLNNTNLLVNLGYVSLSIFNPWIKNTGKLSDDSISDYNFFKVLRIIKSGDRNMVEISIHHKMANDNITRMMIDSDNFNVCQFYEENLVTLKHFSANGKGKRTIEVNFKYLNDTISFVEQIHFTQQMTIKGTFIPMTFTNLHKTDVYYYGFNESPPANYEKEKVKTEKEIEIEKIHSQMDKTPYDQKFWDNIPVIKKSDYDKAFLDSFKGKAYKGNLKID